MIRKVSHLFVVALAVAPLLVAPRALAIDRYFDGGGASTNWNTNANWGVANFVPAAQFNERAVIGYDDPAAILAPTVDLSVTPPAVGGIALGMRERDSGGVFLNEPAPAAGTLMGTLNITAGTVNSRTTGSAATGADGRTLVGVDGRGYLTMTGGILNTTRLVVAGENLATGPGRSRVALSGNAQLHVQNLHNASPNNVNDGLENTASFSRDLRITGPNVIFDSYGRLTLTSTNAYQAEITDPANHSTMRTLGPTGIAVVGGTLAVNFSGAGSSGHAVGERWDLIDSPLGIAGNFSNLGVNSEIAVTGLSSPNPIGTAYRVLKSSDGTGETLSLVYDSYLVLRANRDTGELTVRNPHNGNIKIDGYTVSSALGSMLTSFSGISGQAVPPNAGWFKPVDGSAQPLNTANVLTEIKSPNFPGPPSSPTYDLLGVPSFTLGNGFSKTAVGANVNNFGTDGEDIVFTYSTPDGVIRGHVEYVGTKFENNMVLRVNPTTGQAFLKNDSLETLKFDGYTITSTTGSLVGGTWTGLSAGSGWQKSPLSVSALSQTNPTSSATLAPGAQLAIGDIGAFTTQAQQDGLALKFILSEGLIDVGGGVTPGDFDEDGDVDGRDFLLWQRGGSPGGALNATDLANWQTNYGTSGGGGGNPPETTFRIGSVVFDPTAGVAAATAVPEPSTAILMFSMLTAIAFVGRHRTDRNCQPCLATCIDSNSVVSQRGVQVMSRRMGWCAMALSLSFVASASAVTQGIALTNADFELPGPAGTKVVAFSETGVPFAPTDPVISLSNGAPAGGIPGWTFTGGDGGLGEACPGSGLGCELFGDNIPGDSGTEGKGLGLPGNELILSTVDGKVFQTSGFSLPAAPLPANQKLMLTIDAVNIFTPTGTGQLTAAIYYINGGGSRVAIGSPLNVNTLTATPQKFSLEFVGGSAALTPALGRPIGVVFDTTSREFDALVTQSWAGVDNVLLEIAGTLPGDFNGDGSINLTDYGIIRDNIEEAHSYLFEGDIVRDGFVDLNDFRAWKSLPSVINSGVLAQIASIPEPSSVMLILVSTVAGAFSRRRFGVSDRACAVLLAVVGGLMISLNGGTASAAVLAYDPFLTGASPAAGEYTVGPLVTAVGNGQNPTIGPTSFFTGGWDGGAADSLAMQVQAQGLSFLGSPAGGGAIQSGIVNGAGASRPGRRMASPWTASTTGTYYLSFLMNFGGVGVNPNGTRDDVAHRAIELWDESGNIGDGSAVFRIGYMSYNGNFNSLPPSQAPLKAGPFGQELIIEGGPSSFLADNGTTHLFVLKFELSDQPASDTISIYLNPTENEEPIIAGAVFPGRDFTLGAIGGPVQFGGGGTPVVFDELRVADTFEDALPEFPRKGDTNNDDLVNITDYNSIITHMNLTGQTTLNGDVTGDGRVDLRDLRLWRDNRTDVGPITGDISVPEPASAALMAFALFPLLARRGRRS